MTMEIVKYSSYILHKSQGIAFLLCLEMFVPFQKDFHKILHWVMWKNQKYLYEVYYPKTP